MSSGDQAGVLRSAGAVGSLTLLSRLAGYLRDRVVAYYLGTEMLADAWFAAFRLPNALRRLVGEGNVSAAVVPVFSAEADRRSERELGELADAIHAVIATAAAALTLGGMVATPLLIRWVIIPGAEQAWEAAGRLALICFPYLLFIGMAAALMAVLNSRDRFAAAAFTPVLFNLTIVGCALSLTRWLRPELAIAIGAVTGGFIQWAFQVPFAWRLGMRFRPYLRLADPAMRKIGKLMLPGLFGVGITQINVLVGQALASFLTVGSIASLYYAGRINELTLGIFAISVATVVLPLMSRQAAAGDTERMIDTLGFALRQVTLITLPAAVGLILLRHEIIAVLFQGGEFTAESTRTTEGALWAYATGLVAYAAVRIVAPAFYALHDTRTPVYVAAVAMVVNIGGCIGFMFLLGHPGIALANSIAAYVNSGALLVLLRRRLGEIGGKRLLGSLLKLGAAAALMGWVVRALRDAWQPAAHDALVLQAALLGAVILVGTLTYAAAAAMLGAPELGELRVLLGKRGAGLARSDHGDTE